MRAESVCMDRKYANVLHVLAGQRVGVKEIDEEIWAGGTLVGARRAIFALRRPIGSRFK